MRIFQDLAELKEAVGTHLGWSDWHTVTQQQIDVFAELTGDSQWIHVDPERAAQGPFGGTIAHGYLTLSLIPMLVMQTYAIDGLRMGVNYGVNKVRFPAPLPVGSRIQAGMELVSFGPRNGDCQLVTRVTVEREGGTKPVCVADTVNLLVPMLE